MAYYGNAPADVALVVGSDVITTTEIQDATIATADIANDAITAVKIDDDGTGFQMGSLGLGTAVSGSEKLTVGGTASFTGDVSLSGSLGIGEDNPDQLLHLKQSTGSARIIVESVTDNAGLTLDCGTDGAGGEQSNVIFSENGSAKWLIGKDTGNDFYIYDYTSATSVLEILDNSVFKIAHNDNRNITLAEGGGSVGIGVASASGTLEVNNSTSTNKILLTHSTTDHMGLLIGTNGAGLTVEDNNYFAIWHQDYTNRGTETGLTERIRIESSGLVDIGAKDSGSVGTTGKQLRVSQDLSTVYSESNVGTWGGIVVGNHDDTSNRTASGIAFAHRSSSSGVAGVVSTSDTADRGDLRFITRGTGNAIAERLVIDYDGNSTFAGDITSGGFNWNGINLTAESSSDAPIISKSTDGTTGVQFRDSNSNDGRIYYVGSGNYFYMNNSAELRLRDSGGATDITLNPDGNSYFNAGNFIIGASSASTKMTQGLTLYQGGNDDEIFACQSSDVDHGMTTLADTDTFFCIRKGGASVGGANIQAFASGTSKTGMHIQSAISTSADTAKTSSASGCMTLYGATKTGTNRTILGSNQNIVVIKNDSASRFIFDAEGSGHADVEWTTYSDSRLKLNQEQIPYGLNAINQLQPKIYDRYSGDVQNGEVTLEETSIRQIGFIAQEVKEIIPEIVKDVDESESFYSLDDGKIVAVLVKAVQELSAKVTALENA